MENGGVGTLWHWHGALVSWICRRPVLPAGRASETHGGENRGEESIEEREKLGGLKCGPYAMWRIYQRNHIKIT